jgi:hypothetical protein
MEVFVIFLILITILLAFIWLLAKASSIQKPLSKKQTLVSETPTTFSNVSIDSNKEGCWVLKPKSTFPLTLCGIEYEVAKKIQEILDEGGNQGKGLQDISKMLVPIIIKTGLRVKEIEDYIEKFRPIYLHRIEELKQDSPEWATASEEDREDLLVDFQIEALDSLYIRPYFDLSFWLIHTPPNLKIAAGLLERYGYDNVSFYLKNVSSISKIHHTNPGTWVREKFEKLTELGLAKRGNSIAPELILATLKLKDLNSLASDLNRQFKRKDEAIQFLSKLPDIYQRIGRITPLRGMFQLNQLPSEFSNVDLNKVSLALDFAEVVASLLIHTYFAAHEPPSGEELRYIKGWKVDTVKDAFTCPFCERFDGKIFPKESYPKVPFHIGCRCTVVPITKFE